MGQESLCLAEEVSILSCDRNVLGLDVRACLFLLAFFFFFFFSLGSRFPCDLREVMSLLWAGVTLNVGVYQSKLCGLLAGYPWPCGKKMGRGGGGGRGDGRGTQGWPLTGGAEGEEQPQDKSVFFLDVSCVSKGATLSDHWRSSQLMVFQAAVIGCWDRCLPGVWILLSLQTLPQTKDGLHCPQDVFSPYIQIANQPLLPNRSKLDCNAKQWR